jgi:hypothetical protein
VVASSFGSWTSPITSDLVVAASIRLEHIASAKFEKYTARFPK